MDWLYLRNPSGPVLGFDAYDAETLAAHYACIPTTLRLSGGVCSAILSLNTATHPDYQGRGLFTKLAELTYEAAAGCGCKAVYGVANANSTPGFLRKLGFGLVAPLEAKAGVGGLGGDWDRIEAVGTCVEWDDESLDWRIENPVARVRARDCTDGSISFSARYRTGLSAWAQRPGFLGRKIKRAKSSIPSVRLWLGLAPPATLRMKHYVDVPSKLRPSPLNLIVRAFDGAIHPRPEEVYIDFLDFDAL